MTDRELMQQALEALEFHVKNADEIEEIDLVLVTALRERLEQPVQDGWHTHDLYTDADKDRPDVICDRNGSVTLGLCKRCGRGESQLAEPCDKQPEQEPVAWRTKNATPPGGYVVFQQYPQAVADLDGEIEPLYTTPQPRQWQGLTHDERDAWQDRHGLMVKHEAIQELDDLLREKNT